MCTIFDACYIRSDKTGVDPRAGFRLVCTIHIGQFRGRLMRVTVPHPKDDLPKGTIHNILKQAGLK